MEQDVPAWGSYLYQNFLLPAFSPGSTAAAQWLASPFTTTANAEKQQQQQLDIDPSSFNPASSLDYFGSAWQQDQDLDLGNGPHAGGMPETTDNLNNISNIGRNHPVKLEPSEFDPSGLLAATANLISQPPPYHLAQQQQANTNNFNFNTFPSHVPVPGPSSFFPQPFYPSSNSISTSLLTEVRPQRNVVQAQQQFSSSASVPQSRTQSSSARISPASLEAIDDLVPSVPLSASPSPMFSTLTTPHHSPSPKLPSPKILGKRSSVKRRASSLDSEHDHDHSDYEHHSEHDHEVPEGVERDGMIWGMRVEDYRALSARERKRVRNRISARTFRAKRKEHLNSLESTLGEKDLQIKLSREESIRLRREVENLKKRLSKYEKV